VADWADLINLDFGGDDGGSSGGGWGGDGGRGGALNFNNNRRSGGGGGGGDDSWWGGLLKSLIPLGVGAGTAAAGAFLAPDTPGKIVGIDSRTGTGSQAEDLRLQTAQLANKDLQEQMARRNGPLSPQEQAELYEMQRKVRAENAAAGRLETGPGIARGQQLINKYYSDRNALQEKTISDRFGNAGQLTGGFTPMQNFNIPPAANPWQKIAAAMAVPASQQASKLLDQWTV